MILGLVDPPGRIVAGSIAFEGRELTRLDAAELGAIRGRRISMVFQDATATLNPVLSIGTQMLLAARAHEPRRSGPRGRCASTPWRGSAFRTRLRDFAPPHQLSGGMRQRVAIAIALLHWPALIIADEPTTALDVSVQAQIIHEMRGLVRNSETSLIWITHDLATVSSLADDILVMYAGQVVEAGPTRTILKAPRHPYTRGLLDSVPSRNPRGVELPDRRLDALAPGPPEGLSVRAARHAASPACGHPAGGVR